MEKRRVVTIAFLAFLRGGRGKRMIPICLHIQAFKVMEGITGKTSNKGLEQGVEGFSMHSPGMITGIICYNKSIFKHFC